MTPSEKRSIDRARVGATHWPAASTTTVTARLESRPEMDASIAARFTEFADSCSRFSREIVERSAGWTTSRTDHVRLNMQVARTVFSKWSIEILAFLYSGRAARFQEIKRAIGRISSRVLSMKLSRLERLDLVRRRVLDTRPPSVEYSLTERGHRVAKLGEPVFLYLRLADGMTRPDRP